MSDELRITAEIEDVAQGRPMVPGGRRHVSLEITLPTGEGSEGLNLDRDGWEDAVSTLAQRAVSAGQWAIGNITERELEILVKRLNQQTDRLDALEAEVSGLAADLVREDAKLSKRIDSIKLVARALAALDGEGDDAPA